MFMKEWKFQQMEYLLNQMILLQIKVQWQVKLNQSKNVFSKNVSQSKIKSNKMDKKMLQIDIKFLVLSLWVELPF